MKTLWMKMERRNKMRGPLRAGMYVDQHYNPEHSERPFSTLETRSRISSFQSHASRRDREFLPFSLRLRDEIEIFFLSVSGFETRSRISFS